jgi:hypothetical protein
MSDIKLKIIDNDVNMIEIKLKIIDNDVNMIEFDLDNVIKICEKSYQIMK